MREYNFIKEKELKAHLSLGLVLLLLPSVGGGLPLFPFPSKGVWLLLVVGLSFSRGGDGFRRGSGVADLLLFVDLDRSGDLLGERLLLPLLDDLERNGDHLLAGDLLLFVDVDRSGDLLGDRLLLPLLDDGDLLLASSFADSIQNSFSSHPGGRWTHPLATLSSNLWPSTSHPGGGM